MYETVIWATDGSVGADAALEEALRVVGPSGRLIAVHCDQRLSGRAMRASVLADEHDRRAKLYRRVGELRDEGVDIELVVRHSHHEPADVVATVAAEFGGDVIVCGTRGLGAISGALLGSFTQRLLHVASCPVLAVREHETITAKPEREEAKVRT